jgi:hypothetical protein
MSDDTPTQRYPVGGEPVPPAGGVPPAVPPQGDGVPPAADPVPTPATTPLADPMAATTPMPDPASDAPTERFVPPPPPPVVPAGAGSDDLPPKKGKGLLITLISIGAALLLALIILLIILFTRGGEPTPTSSPSVSSPSPTPSETTPSPTPSETEAPPVVPGPAIASYTAAPTTVDCTAGGAQPVHFTWSTTGTTLWFGVGTNDASAEPFGTFPTTHEMDFNYQCGQTGAQQRYTITVQGENGEKTSQTIVIQETS